jgi:hypothetical protein
MGSSYLFDPVNPRNDMPSKPFAAVIEGSLLPLEPEGIHGTVKFYADRGLPVYHSFDSAATAIDLVLSYYDPKDWRS